MKSKGRYQAASSEAEYEPGSNEEVLKNLLSISQVQEIELIETEKLVELTASLIENFNQDQCITVADILLMHENWLANIYVWAGQYRTVNVSKDGFTFAAAYLIPRLMESFEKNILQKYTPCLADKKENIAYALAVVHVEFVLIHPFREGNGRLARLISSIMAIQAGMDLLDFSVFNNEKKEQYFSAVRAGLDCNYKPMATIFYELI